MMEEDDDEGFVSNRAAGETSMCPEDMVVEEAEREALLAEERRAVEAAQREVTSTEATRQHEGERSEEEQHGWRHPSGARVIVQNVVATANLRISIDLKKVALSARNAEYNPKKFSAVIMRIREPRCTGLIFSTGKMVCTGAKSERESKIGARKFAAILRKIGFEPRFTEFTIQNMVSTADVGFPIKLEQLVYAHSKFSSYEPELFPGCIYRLVMPRTVLLLFVSGRMVITGGKSLSHLHTAFDKIFPVLVEFKKDVAPFHRRDSSMYGPGGSPSGRSESRSRSGPPSETDDSQIEQHNPSTTLSTTTTALAHTTTTTALAAATTTSRGENRVVVSRSDPQTLPRHHAEQPPPDARPARRLTGAPRIRASGRPRFVRPTCRLSPASTGVLPTVPDRDEENDDDDDDDDLDQP